MVLHVLFLKDGTPAWVGPEAREGSEAIEDRTVEFLAAHCRTAKGIWVARPAPVVDEPSPEEQTAQAEADYAAALAARRAALRDALSEEADPLFFQWQRGEVAKEDWLAAVSAVRARFPKPEHP